MRISSPDRLAYLLTAVVISFTILPHQLIYAQVVSSSEQTAINPSLTQLPTANQKIVAAVYAFRLSADQQLQATTNAVQATASINYTNILFEVLRTSNWFNPLEYSNAGSLLNKQPDKPVNQASASEAGNVSPTPEPTVILEAGLFSHDANTVTGEAGSVYFTNGGSNQFRQDRATVFLRALSTQSGKILKTVYWTRTVLSQPTSGNTYRYAVIDQPNRPLTGTTSASPDQLAIVEAMKQAVRGLIIEGVRDGLWVANDVSPTQIQTVIAAYEAEKMSTNEKEKPTANSGREQRARPKLDPSFISLCLYGGLIRYHGDYVSWDTKGTYGLSVEAYITPRVGVQFNAATGTLASQNAFSTNLTSLEANVMIRVLPYWRLTPLVYGGVGLVSRSTDNPFAFEGTKYLQYQGGVGLQYALNNVVGFRAMVAYNQPHTDMLDGKRTGSHNDFYVRTTLGVLLQFGRYVPRPTQSARQ